MADKPKHLTLADAIGLPARKFEQFHVEQHVLIEERLAVLEDLVQEISRLLADDGK